MNSHDPRTAELAERLAAVQGRIAAALQPDALVVPKLIVVTKFHPAADVTRLRSLGVADVGENRDQEAAAKSVEVGDPLLRWHFIGQLQGNKAKSVVRYAHSVHSIDRASLASALGKAMAAEQDATGRADLACYIQVDLSETAEETQGSGRGGAAPSSVPALAEQITGTPGLSLAGVMAVAPLGADPDPAFELLAGISAKLRVAHPGAKGISAGMSQDLEEAIRWGATHLRVGSDILGPRPQVG